MLYGMPTQKPSWCIYTSQKLLLHVLYAPEDELYPSSCNSGVLMTSSFIFLKCSWLLSCVLFILMLKWPKEWVKCKRVFHLVLFRCVRVARWLWIRIWLVLCGFRWQKPEKVSEAIGTMVLQFLKRTQPSGNWNFSKHIILIAISVLSVDTVNNMTILVEILIHTDHVKWKVILLCKIFLCMLTNWY